MTVLPMLASAPGGIDVTCTVVPGAPRTLKLDMLKLGMPGIPPQPDRAAQLSAKAIARRMIKCPQHPLPRVTYKIGDLRVLVSPRADDIDRAQRHDHGDKRRDLCQLDWIDGRFHSPTTSRPTHRIPKCKCGEKAVRRRREKPCALNRGSLVTVVALPCNRLDTPNCE